jgi:hypothetical protein
MARSETTDARGQCAMRSGAAAFAAALVISTLAAGTTFLLARRWAPSLSAFGESLPASATIALSISPWLLVLPAVIALAWVFSGHPRIGLAASVCILSVLFALASIAAMYLPLFKLAAVL